MSVDKLVDSTQLDSDLTSVANAIRTKGGTSASLAFPTGFVDAIDAIETGGASAQTATGTFTGNDTQYARFTCTFSPDAVYIVRINVVSLSERVFAGFIGGTFGSNAGNVLYQNNANATAFGSYTGNMTSKGFTYSNGTVQVATQTTRPVSSSCEYRYYAVKWTQ